MCSGNFGNFFVIPDCNNFTKINKDNLIAKNCIIFARQDKQSLLVVFLRHLRYDDTVSLVTEVCTGDEDCFLDYVYKVS